MHGPAYPPSPRVWLFDLDNTLHDASHASLGHITDQMTRYMRETMAIGPDEADALRRRYWLRYGATLVGLVRHHGVKAEHFLHHTHVLPGLESRLRAHPHDVAALARLPRPRCVLTNAPRSYALRVLDTLALSRRFDAVFTIEDMAMFGQLRPKPDARMLRRLAARLRVPPSRCVLVEDTLEHQKAARRIGMTTVWLRRWIRAGPQAAAPRARRPAYVDHIAGSIAAIARRLR